jgi:hypothetical protein
MFGNDGRAWSIAEERIEVPIMRSERIRAESESRVLQRRLKNYPWSS